MEEYIKLLDRIINSYNKIDSKESYILIDENSIKIIKNLRDMLSHPNFTPTNLNSDINRLITLLDIKYKDDNITSLSFDEELIKNINFGIHLYKSFNEEDDSNEP